MNLRALEGSPGDGAQIRGDAIAGVVCEQGHAPRFGMPVLTLSLAWENDGRFSVNIMGIPRQLPVHKENGRQ